VPLPEGAKATPVARRVAAAHGVDLARVKGTGPDGRIGKDDVLAAARTAPPPRRTAQARRGATLLKGARAMLARYMDESRSIPTATSFRTITVTALDGRRKQLKAPARRSPSRT
jgi:2-oxoglutarate dehydrogenase E1 component